MLILLAFVVSSAVFAGDATSEVKVEGVTEWSKKTLDLHQDLEPGETIGKIIYKKNQQTVNISQSIENGLAFSALIGTGRVHTNDISLSSYGMEIGSLKIKGKQGLVLGAGIGYTYLVSDYLNIEPAFNFEYFGSKYKGSGFGDSWDGKLKEYIYDTRILARLKNDNFSIYAGPAYINSKIRLKEEEDKTKLDSSKPWQTIVGAEYAASLEGGWGAKIEGGFRNKDNISGTLAFNYRF